MPFSDIYIICVLVILSLTPQNLKKILTTGFQALKVYLGRRHLKACSVPPGSVVTGVWWKVKTNLFFRGFASTGWNTWKWEMFCFRMAEYKINIYHGGCWHPIKKSSTTTWKDALGGFVREISFPLNEGGSSWWNSKLSEIGIYFWGI